MQYSKTHDVDMKTYCIAEMTQLTALQKDWILMFLLYLSHTDRGKALDGRCKDKVCEHFKKEKQQDCESIFPTENQNPSKNVPLTSAYKVSKRKKKRVCVYFEH